MPGLSKSQKRRLAKKKSKAAKALLPIPQQNAQKPNNTKSLSAFKLAPSKASFDAILKAASLGASPKAEALSVNVILPGPDAPIHRMPSTYAASKTAVSGVYKRIRAPWGTGVSELFAIATRIAECAYIYRDPNTAGSTYKYDLQLSGDGTAPGSSVDLPLLSSDTEWLRSPFANAVVTYAPHGPKLFAGSISGHSGRFYYMETGSTISFTILNGDANPADYTFTLAKYTRRNGLDNSFDVHLSTVAAGGSHVFSSTADEDAYYAIGLAGTTSAGLANALNATVLTARIEGNLGVNCHRCLPQYESICGEIGAICVKGSSVLYSNTSAENSNEGQIVGVQITPGMDWRDFTTYDDVDSMPSSEVRPAARGAYVWRKPLDETDLTMRTCLTISDTVVYDSCWPIDRMGPMLAMVVQITNASGQLGRWTFSFTTEFSTTSQWFDCEEAEGTPQDVERALMIIKHVPFMHENPTHMRNILNAVKKYGKSAILGTIKYGPRILETAQQLAPLMV